MSFLYACLRLLFLKLFQLRLLHFDRIKTDPPAIIMPNHVSFLDAVILALFLPEDIVFVINSEMAEKIRPVLKLRQSIAIDPLNPYSIREIIAAIKEGMSVVIFPEGRLTKTNGIMKIYDGIGFIALKTGATVYPVGIDGVEYSKFTRLQDKMPSRWFPPITLYVDEPFQILPARKQSAKDQKAAATRKILQALQRAVFRSRHRKGINLFNELLRTGKIVGWNREIVEDLNQKSTYKQLILGTYGLSGQLKPLLGNESRVGVLLPNSIAHVVTLFALFRINVAPAILNFTTGPQGLLDCCETAELKTVLTSRLFIEKAGLEASIKSLTTKVRIIYLEDVKASIGFSDKIQAFSAYLRKERAVEKKDTLILFTSGSESKPKGVLLRHENIRANILQAVGAVDLTYKDKLLNALPMFHSFGLQGALIPLLYGFQSYLYPSPLHYKIVPEIAYDRSATLLFATATFLHGYGQNAHPFDFYSIRYLIVGGEKLKEETRRLCLDKFGLRPLEGYGCTEASPFISIVTPLNYKAGTVGLFLPDIEYRLEPVEGIDKGGKLLIKGPNIMEGYLIHNQGFIPAEEWYDCGDLVDVDEQGFITVLSRLKRFAKLGGEMVSLNLVEELAAKCFQSTDMAVVSLGGGRKGEQIILFTTLEHASKSVLRDYIVKAGHSPLMFPSRICHLAKLPLLGNGKTDYVSLRTDYGEVIGVSEPDEDDLYEEKEAEFSA
ncbi:AMP-binding protein [Heliobacterium chlorum]|uniref:AMP-binding protein n=1 Tax=Heliobacterium chlorum TaxID=2698 RepID=A0ABR7T2R8_HELCL|nr:AMP-binding protein [Heliobacterium chlorum]MBC9783956.1 AMP-binding protein [Heliobacterium chlorum]